MSKYTVALDFGHGGADPGAMWMGVRESWLVREIGRHLVHHLTIISQGEISVVCVAPLDNEFAGKDSLSHRAMLVNSSKADIVVSVHINAATNPRASGFEVIYCPGSRKGLILADQIHEALDTGDNGNILPRRPGPITDIQCGRGFGFTMLRKTRPPAAIVEAGFITNDRDQVEIVENCSNISTCIAVGIWNYFTGD